MKKFILPLLLLLSLSMLIAVESEASDVVGYFKIAPTTGIQSGMRYPFSIPFSYDDLEVNNVIGAGFNDEDYLEDLATGDNSFFFDEWIGSLYEFSYGSAYWFERNANNDPMDFYLMGKVDPQPINFTMYGNTRTPFSLNEARNVPLNGPDFTYLFPDAVDEDYIEDLDTGENAFFFGEWIGDITDILPTHVYWYESHNSDDFYWTYDPSNPYGSPTRIYGSRNKK